MARPRKWTTISDATEFKTFALYVRPLIEGECNKKFSSSQHYAWFLPKSIITIIIIIIIIIIHVYTGDLPATTVDVMGGPVIIKY